MIDNKKYILVGPPNVGKSTYYNKLTWKVSPVGNVDRVTTTSFEARLRANNKIKLIDLPGIVGLNPVFDDEVETFKFIFNNEYDGIINIVSALTLNRDLFLTYELAEAGVLSMLQINMIDEVDHLSINNFFFTNAFKVIVNELSAKKNIGVKNSIIPILTNSLNKRQALKITYTQKIEKFIDKYQKLLPPHKLSKRFLIIQALNDNSVVIDWLKQNNIYNDFLELKKELKINQEDIDEIKNIKNKLISDLIQKAVIKTTNQNKLIKFEKRNKLQIVLDKVFLNKYFSFPIFILIIAAIWFLTFFKYTGGWLQEKLATDGFEQLQDIIFESISNIKPGDNVQIWWGNFVANGLLGGIFTVLSFIPWIIILTFLMTILEQIGIISRMTIMFDRAFDKFGISGRSVIHMIVGVGCNVPSIMMSRNANSFKERVISVLIMPFVSCGARVIVYGFISQAFVDANFTWLFNFGLSALSVVFALCFGYFFSNTLFRKKNSFFIGELSPYRSPDFYVIIKKIVLELYDFLKRVILIVGLCNLIIWILTNTGPSTIYLDSSDPIQMSKSFLRYLSIPFQYIMYPTGLGQHWQLTISLITAFPAKEIASSNIELIFGGPNGFNQFIFSTNLPISISLSFLSFFSFYIPCMAVVAVMNKEIGKKYTSLHIVCSLIGSWIFSTFIFTISGLIEKLSKGIDVNIYAALLPLLLIFLMLYVVIAIIKQIRLLKNNVVSLRLLWTYRSSIWLNTCLFASVLITSNVLLLVK